jgi:hypothetical protein
MTTDMERELRELFREKAGEAPVATFGAPAAAPQDVLRRGRRLQVGTVLGSAAIVLVLIVGSVAGLNAVFRGEGDPFTTGKYEAFERTATIEAITITSPSDWYLVNRWSGWPAQREVQILQLSNVDLGLASNVCEDGVPAGGAALSVVFTGGHIIDADPDGPWPNEFRAYPNGPCGSEGEYAYFTVSGWSIVAWMAFGEGVSDAERDTLLAAVDSMSVASRWEPQQAEDETPAYVTAGGVNEAGDDWRLEVRPSHDNIRLSLVGGGSLIAASSDFVVPRSVIEWAATDPIFGAVTKQATAVEFRSKDDPSVAIAGTIVPLPPTLAFDFDLFFVEGTAGIEGEAVAVGPDGETVDGPTSVGRLRQDVVKLSGSLLGHDWSARFSGAFGDESACIRVLIGEPYHPLCLKQLESSLAGPQPSLHGWLTEELMVFAGSVPPEVVEVRFTSDDGTQPPSQFRCQVGPSGWTNPDKNVCAIALPPEGSGTLQYLDTNGAVLFEDGNGWGSAQASPNAIPWTNEAGAITAEGTFQGADWKLKVLHYRNGYRLTIDGRVVFQGTLHEGEPAAFPLFEGDRSRFDALVLLVDGGQFAEQLSITSEGTWDGRWLPGSTAGGAEARLWIVEVPGAGTGSLLMDGVDRGNVSWP